MVKTEVVFGAVEMMTPDFAAKLANQASGFSSEIFLLEGSTQLCVDSLIGILAMDLRRGMRIEVCAEGADEGEALESICTLLRAG